MKKKVVFKRFLCLVILLLTTSSLRSADYMNLYLNSQSAFQSVFIDDIEKITFSSDDEVVVLMQDDVFTNVLIDDIGVITFGNSDITSVEEAFVEDNEIDVIYSQQAGAVLIESAENISFVQIYNMQGVQVLAQSPNANSAAINIQLYPKGIYIVAVRVGEEIKTVKIIK